MDTTEHENIAALRGRYGAFFQAAQTHFSPESVAVLEQVLSFVDNKLAGLKRYDGTPLLDHSVNTALIVIEEIGLGRNSAIATLLHDAVRMGLIDTQTAGELFGEQCVPLLQGMSDISDVRTKVSAEQADNFRELIVSYSSDPRVILIKLADRLEVMRSLVMFPPKKRAKKSWESINLYAQIAHKLGLYRIKSELEDLALSYLEADAYKDIQHKLQASAAERERFIARFVEPLREKLNRTGIKYAVKSRTKSVFSIWSKMKRVGIPFEEVFDIFAIRIIIDCPPELEKQQCWAVFSIITDVYTPNPERMRDWISIPKSNGYESLHTTVVDGQGNWVEIQIRTERMDEIAEKGIAAHWRYKGVRQGGISSEQWLARVRELMEADSHGIDKRMGKTESIGEIFVFTPKGDLRKLPEGATVLDFAFDIHTNVGAACTGGRVNQRNVPLKQTLRNGDIVEIITSKTQTPKPDWLNIVTTNRARNKIKAYMREQEARAASLGREELERKLKNWKLGISMDDALTVLCKYYKVKTGTEVYGRIAAQKIDIADIKDILLRHLDGETFTAEPKPRSTSAAKVKPQQVGDALIIDDTIRNLDYKMSKCCNPIFGDEVFGFVTVNSGITIHSVNCPNAARLRQQYDYRIIPAQWRESEGAQGAFQASIRVVAENTTGMVNRITELIAQQLKINIRSMNMIPNTKGEIVGLINIEVSSKQTIDMVVYKIGALKGVARAYRVTN